MQKVSKNEVLMLIRETGGHSGGTDQNSIVNNTALKNGMEGISEH